jgi:hypothetical protein
MPQHTYTWDDIFPKTHVASPAKDFLRGHIDHVGDECLIWPFSRFAKQGYGRISVAQRVTYAHRVMCFLAHGEAPTPGHHAAHSCGNGHLGCVNPNHLAWETPKQNNADKIAHGTLVRGTRHYRAKLSADQVREIRARTLGPGDTKRLAERFGVSHSVIHRVRNGGYKDVAA